MLLLIIILILVFGVGGGYYGNRTYPGWGGPGFGLGTVLVILLILWLLSSYGGMHLFSR